MFSLNGLLYSLTIYYLRVYGSYPDLHNFDIFYILKRDLVLYYYYFYQMHCKV